MDKYFVDVINHENLEVAVKEVFQIFLSSGDIIIECKDFYYRKIFNLHITEEDLEELKECPINDIIEYLLNYKEIIDQEFIKKEDFKNDGSTLIYSNEEEIKFNIEDFYYNY